MLVYQRVASTSSKIEGFSMFLPSSDFLEPLWKRKSMEIPILDVEVKL